MSLRQAPLDQRILPLARYHAKRGVKVSTVSFNENRAVASAAADRSAHWPRSLALVLHTFGPPFANQRSQHD